MHVTVVTDGRACGLWVATLRSTVAGQSFALVAVYRDDTGDARCRKAEAERIIDRSHVLRLSRVADQRATGLNSFRPWDWRI